MNMPGFYNFKTGGRGDPMVSMLMAAIPILPAEKGTKAVEPFFDSAEQLDGLVLIYHLFLKQHDPFCVIVSSGR